MSSWPLDALLELVPGYVMETLGADERALLELALATPGPHADALRAEIAAMREVLPVLAADVATAPPPSLRARTLARMTASAKASADAVPDAPRLAAEPAAASAGTVGEPTPVPAPPALRVSRPTPQRPVAAPPPRPSSAGWWVSGLLATALAASLVIILRLDRRLDEMDVAVRAGDARLDRLNVRLAERDSTLAALLGAEGELALVRLVATAPGPEPRAAAGPGVQLFWNTRAGRAVVHAYRFAPSAEGRVYALWMIRNGQPVMVANFVADDSGQAQLRNVSLPTDRAGITAFAITDEAKDSDMAAPTSAPFVVGTVAP